MSESEQMAKSAHDRLFELSVHARRAKKERLVRAEEELKGQDVADMAAALAERVDPDQLDVLFQLVDFPQTRGEAVAFAKHALSLNCIFEVKEAGKVDEEGRPIEEEEVI
mmetsp:Transcript_5574/g.4242  ORF Transcript_5574/g.4242 Transcript_5574/m.4242 type:complete len:110 (-) Transcript_5574:224-553(-)